MRFSLSLSLYKFNLFHIFIIVQYFHVYFYFSASHLLLRSSRAACERENLSVIIDGQGFMRLQGEPLDGEDS